VVNYSRLLDRVHQVADDIQMHAHLRPNLERAGVVDHDTSGHGAARRRLYDCQRAWGFHLQADRIILCAGGTSRRLPIQGSS
jgi:dihydrolipoamide dehydrogenase